MSAKDEALNMNRTNDFPEDTITKVLMLKTPCNAHTMQRFLDQAMGLPEDDDSEPVISISGKVLRAHWPPQSDANTAQLP